MRPKRSLGQNFLVDPNLQRKIVDALEIGPGDTVVEIGPGQGALTRHIAGAAHRLVAVELDDRLAHALTRRYRDDASVQVVHGDILEWDPATAARGEAPGVQDGGREVASDGGRDAARDEQRVGSGGGWKVVGNIPYNITSPILFRVMEWRPVPERLVIMVQKEVADRLRATPGEKAYGALTVGIRAVADVEKLFDVGRQSFRPVPNVDSTVVRLQPRGRPAGGEAGEGSDPDGAIAPDALRALTRAAFGMRRKQLQKILRTAPGYRLEPERAEAVLAEVGVRPSDRPEVVDPDTFVELAAALDRLGFPREGETP